MLGLDIQQVPLAHIPATSYGLLGNVVVVRFSIVVLVSGTVVVVVVDEVVAGVSTVGTAVLSSLL